MRRRSSFQARLIVIENASTWDSYSRWNSAHGSFSAVVYGGGNRFLDSVARLSDIFTEIGGPRGVLYFGDLDPQGLRIPQIASRRAQLQGLPAIESDSWNRDVEEGRSGSLKVIPIRQSRRVVTAIFQPPQPVDKNGCGFRSADVSENPAHKQKAR